LAILTDLAGLWLWASATTPSDEIAHAVAPARLGQIAGDAARLVKLIAVLKGQLRRRRRIAKGETQEYNFNSFGMPIDNEVAGRISLDAYSSDHLHHARVVIHG
jgi:hypothetical protein